MGCRARKQRLSPISADPSGISPAARGSIGEKTDAGIQFWLHCRAKGFSSHIERIFPFRPERVLLLLVVFVYIGVRERTNAPILPVVLALVFTFNAALVYIADSMEVQRHEYFTMTMVQFSFVLTLSLLCDTNLALALRDGLRDGFRRWAETPTQ